MKTSAENKAKIGLGTYQLGPRTYESCITALKIGYRYIDTARLYKNERDVFRAVKDSAIPRQNITICTKVSAKDIQNNRIVDSVKESIDKLEYIDLLLLHQPLKNPKEEWNILKEVGEWKEIRAIGVSNYGIEDLKSLEAPIPSVNQIELSPFLTRKKLVEYCVDNNIAIVAHTPLTKARQLDKAKLLEIAIKLNLSPATLLLQWSIQKGFFPLARSANAGHLKENWMAQFVDLSEDIINKLDQLNEGYATHPKVMF